MLEWIEERYNERKEFYLVFLYEFLWVLSIIVCVFLFFSIGKLKYLETTQTPIFISAEPTPSYTPSKGTVIYAPCVYHANNLTCPENYELYQEDNVTTAAPFCYSTEDNCEHTNYTMCYPRLYENATIVANTSGLVMEYEYTQRFNNLNVLQNCFVAIFIVLLVVENGRLVVHYLRNYYIKWKNVDYYNLEEENGETQNILLPKTEYRTLSIKLKMPINFCFLFGCHMKKSQFSESERTIITRSFISSGIFWAVICMVVFGGSGYFIYMGYSLPTAFMTDMLNMKCFSERENIMHFIMVQKHIYVWLVILLCAITIARVTLLTTVLTLESSLQ